MTASSEQRIKYVATQLGKGVKRKEIVQQCKKLYNVQPAIVDRYIKHAKLIVNEKNQKHEAIVEAKTIQVLEREAELNVLTKIRKRELLHDIAEGKAKIDKVLIISDSEGGEKAIKISVPPTFKDRIAAVNVDNEMSGDNAPTKSLIVTQNLDDLSNLSYDELTNLIALGESEINSKEGENTKGAPEIT